MGRSPLPNVAMCDSPENSTVEVGIGGPRKKQAARDPRTRDRRDVETPYVETPQDVM